MLQALPFLLEINKRDFSVIQLRGRGHMTKKNPKHLKVRMVVL